MSNKFLKFKNGFSLIELLVAFTLIIIMTGVLLVSQNNNKDQENANTAARQVAAQLRALQNEALNGKQTGTTLTAACDFKFDANNGSKFYTISYNDCSSSHSVIAGSAQQIDLNSGKGNVAISDSNGSAVSISFSAPRGELSANAKITLTSNGKEAYVLVCSSGNIFDTKNSSDRCT